MSDLVTDTIAVVGGEAILARDLIDRMELMPWPGKDNPLESDSARIRALQSLVAERILALDATVQGLGDDRMLKRQVLNTEKLMVRDQLYREEVVPKVSVASKEVREGVRRFAWIIRALMVGTRSQEDARTLQAVLQRAADRDSLLSRPPTEFPVTTDTIRATFGLLEQSQEDVVYALSEAHPVSLPLKVPRLGWVVLCFLERESNPEYTKRSIDERVNAVKSIIRRRKEAELAARYAGDMLAPRRAEARPDTFDLFARTIYNILVTDSLAYGNNAGYRLDFIVDAAEDKLRPYLASMLVDMDGGGMTIEDVLEGYRAFDFALPNLDKNDVRQRLNASVRELVGREYLTREGYHRRLNRNPDVEHDIETWRNYWLAELLKRQILKDVSMSESNVLEYLISHAVQFGQSYEVNVREILSDSLSESVSALERISNGENMSAVARAFSRRKEWAGRGGESGFFPVSRHPEIGFHALISDTGSIVGPLKTSEGYSLFTVLAKRHRAGAISFDSLKAEVRQRLFLTKVQDQLNQYVASAAQRYQVKLFYNHVKDINVPAANMVTRRLIGFGGTMMASPGLYPLWDWVRKAPNVIEVLP